MESPIKKKKIIEKPQLIPQLIKTEIGMFADNYSTLGHEYNPDYLFE